MRDYTSNGVPVAELSTAFIQDCLADGIAVTEGDGLPNNIERVCERLKLELEIRASGLREVAQ